MTGGSAESYEGQRKQALTRRSADLGLKRVPGRPAWGVIMEIGSAEGVTTLVATDDGAVGLFTDHRADDISFAKSEWPHRTGARFVGAAGDCLFECSPAWAYPKPDPGMIIFYPLTYDGVMTAQARADELVAGGDAPLSALFYAGHDVLTLVRLVTDEPDWAAYGPARGQAEGAPLEAGDGAGAQEPAGGEANAPAGASNGEQASDEAANGEQASGEATPAAAPGSELLLRAAARNDVDEVARLLALGHDPGPNAKGLTPLMAAAHAGALEPLRLLLAAGVAVDIHDSHGFTALMLACNAGHGVCARLLLGAGAEVEARDGDGSTPLMFAAQNGHDDIVRLLMERDADPAAVNADGLSAIGLATQKGYTRTVTILLGKDD
jgi:uncharacterized protein